MKNPPSRILRSSLWAGILLSVLLSSFSASAQKIRFCDPTNRWVHPYCDWSTGGMEAYWYWSQSAYTGDTIIAGNNYLLLSTTAPSTGSGTAAVREDTALGKVYYRRISGNDTAEHVLYDYNLKLGDTLDFETSLYKYHVWEMDSVEMAGQYYKRWRLTNNSNMYLIEGIGTTYSPLSFVFRNSFENAFQLRCFSNNGLQQSCKPATPLFSTHVMYPLFAPQPIPVDSFDNDSSCVIKYYRPSQVSGIKAGQKVQIVPNPGGPEAILIMPSGTRVYTLTIRDAVGRIVATVTQSRAQQQPIGKLLQTEGLYFYSVEMENDQRYSGKFLFR